MAKTLIPYVTDVANVIRTKDGGYHCTKLSEGCRFCWAEAFNRRFGNGRPYDATPTEFVLDERPFERLARARKSRRVFVCSMCDICHPDVPTWMFHRVFAWMAVLERHTFIVLTKRPERLTHYMANADWGQTANTITDRFIRPLSGDLYLGGEIVPPLPNVWLGVSVEDQPTFDERWAHLSRIQAAVRFVSYEPALSPIDTAQVFGLYEWEDGKWALKVGSRWEASPDWMIMGCESGPGARPMDEAWARSMRGQCRKAAVPFFLKQMVVGGKLVKMPKLDGMEHREFPALPTTIPR